MKRITVLLLGVSLVSACAEPLNTTQKGAMIGTGTGAAAGAALGQAIGRDTGSTLIGAAIGAAVGGVAGGLIGNYMDKQEAQLRQSLANVEGASIQRTQDVLAVTFKSDVMFGVGSSTLKGGAMDEIDRVASVLNQYPQTSIMIAGHTDSTGTVELNQRLSERRAVAVKHALADRGVSESRMTTIGYGESHPIADNSTEGGRQLNRRVTVTIIPHHQ